MEESVSLDFLLKLGAIPAAPATTGAAAHPNSGKPLKPAAESAKTLDSYHAQNLSKIREEKASLEDLKKELGIQKAAYARLEKEFNSPVVVTTAADIQALTSLQQMEKEIHTLTDKIAKLESNDSEADYFLRVGDILFSYNDAQQRIAGGERPLDPLSKKTRMPVNSVYSYFSSNADVETTPTNIVVEEKRVEPSKIEKASDVRNDIGFRRDKALEQYLTALNPDSLLYENSIANSISEDYGNCPLCEAEMFFNETFLDCPTCGFRDCILIDSEKPSYKDPPREMSYYAYKKINHLNEWLAQFQAKETTEISPAVLDLIRAELKKERITDMSKLKASKLKEVIKKLKLNRCYDHVAHVLNRLNGISAPVLSREVEEKLRFMFKEIQFSFVKHCPKKRSNFLSYSFVLYKFCELLELDEYLPCFPLLKSREKLYMQDKIWQKICEDMRWEFIRTV
jgi:Zn finger protein HypA/HybF involved in hydrogenase expression